VGYATQWGPPPGRDDLGIIKALGANAVRLYHSMGLNSVAVSMDHAPFLDRARSLGLSVLSGMDSSAELCPGFDCFEHVKHAVIQGFQQGYSRGERWHPAIAAVILLNEPDFFENDPRCIPQNGSSAWCRVKASLSSLDGFLAAEREANISDEKEVRLSITWSFAVRSSVDGLVEGPGIFGFQDMVAIVREPNLANYTPRTPLAELQKAFQRRWVHGLNTQAPWSYVHEFISQRYESFKPIPWFIGEYGANGQQLAVIKSDLQSMEASALDGDFLGAAVFEFQTSYQKGGSELNFGLFSLGKELIGDTGKVCDVKAPCRSWPVYCLRRDLPWLPGDMGLRAEAVADASPVRC